MQDDKCRVNNCTGSSTEEIPHLIGFLDEDSNLEIVLADTLQAENSRDEAILFYKKVSKRGKQRRSFPSTESLPSYTNDDVMEYRSTRFFCTSASRQSKKDHFFQKQYQAFDLMQDEDDDDDDDNPSKGGTCDSSKCSEKQDNCVVRHHHFLEFLPDDTIDPLPEIISSFDSEVMC